jgi:tRNA1(Val) A37 N6-methylase TrmN6
VVLDVGAGAGLLSLMAVRAGATRVLAIENSQHMAAIAREAVAANHMADKITVRPPRKDVAKCWARGPDVERCDPLRDTRRLCA